MDHGVADLNACREAVREEAVEELFRATVIAFLAGKGLLPPDRARMLKSWKHSGFNVHRSRRIQPDEREDLERVARYIIRNPFSTEKMKFKPPNAVNKDGTVIYRSGMNPKIHRNFQIFTPCNFIAAITQHIPDKSFQLVRYYGWYSKRRPKGDRLPEGRSTCSLASRAHGRQAPGLSAGGGAFPVQYVPVGDPRSALEKPNSHHNL